ncbi:MAG: DUF3870 domain-containing protein [Nitrospirae bacterium]|nr:DUF3870 domain-containing protein [Nitrospirota bacterium]
MKHPDRTLFIGGSARLPKEISAVEVLQVIMEVEAATGKVLDAEFFPCSELVTRMLKQLVVGMSLPDDANEVLNEIELRLFHRSKKAVITAIKDLVREYREYQYRASKGFQPPSVE